MLGKPVSDFSLPSTGNSTFSLASARGSKLVLYFYPKDNTPGCTQQGSDFRDRYKEFKRDLHEAAFELIEIPHVRQSGKNSADISPALDDCFNVALLLMDLTNINRCSLSEFLVVTAW